ncbi:hypothetical protein IX332_001133 [Porphyromonas levii]|uniref:hypothetical protein n=1 Tax=Porphyromonas levii TaxID=28114 RepID=UPI00035C0A17|nr:hypothetical protein [Porphyromonas levii]MBR8729809.1 hypothetical protein [Porphyromonas levii]MBR8759851.1 hypothetical protein [Porphyromonas levii]MBR8770347.1 hypothetical protein [Porphyromonas levii]
MDIQEFKKVMEAKRQKLQEFMRSSQLKDAVGREAIDLQCCTSNPLKYLFGSAGSSS